jgi:hypothetical protein
MKFLASRLPAKELIKVETNTQPDTGAVRMQPSLTGFYRESAGIWGKIPR